MISFFSLDDMQVLGHHITKKPGVQAIKFIGIEHACHKKGNHLFLYGDFKDLILFDWKRQEIVRKWQYHRNVILQVDFLPFVHGRYSLEKTPIYGISMAFDHSIKVWNVAEKNDSQALVDKIHGSHNQPFTAFCFYENTETKVNDMNQFSYLIC
jgi:hypothetical protein